MALAKNHLSLKRLISKKEVSSLIVEMLPLTGDKICIQDALRQPLMGNVSVAPSPQYPVKLNGEVIGWVTGDEKASPIASLLTYLANKEMEKKTLARETLERYKEINLLYEISGKMTACLDLKEIAKLALDETKRLIKATSGSLMLINEKGREFYIIAAFGEEYNQKLIIKPGEGIAGNVALTGRAEIINDVWSDPRFIPRKNRVSSLMCAPLNTTQKVIGVINISNEKQTNYTASDLKLLTAIASQAAAAIENALLHENKLKEARIKSNLERYLASQVVEAILGSKGEISLEPDKKNITILFSDIRNFTQQCEQLAPEKIVEYLNEYFTQMVEVIFSNGGTVNKFVGDMIVAIFGAPSPLENSEQKALQTAIEMQKRLKMIAVPWIRDNFNTGIGISSGKVVVGNVGSPRHMDYTAIGDEVNVASRLQSLAQGGQILISRSVYELNQHKFKFKEIGNLKVKGKKKTVEVFEVLY
ncbi:MAG: adenylate/guanylate cyclase domain-containing protein [Potamolinea sp.]